MSTSFFRREISFRRKKTMDGAPAAAEHDFDAELSDAAEDHEDEPAEVVAEVVAEADRWAAPELVAALVVDADDSDGVDDAVVAEPVIAKAVPFYKRELGFRRKKTVAQEATVVVAADAVPFEDETSDDTTEVAAHADEPVVAWARSDEQAEETNVMDEYVACRGGTGRADGARAHRGRECPRGRAGLGRGRSRRERCFVLRRGSRS